MKHLRLYIVLTAAAAVTPFVVRIAQGQEQEVPVTEMPQQGANETAAMPNEMQGQEAQGTEEQPVEAMPEQQQFQPETMDATSQPATTQSVAEEDDTSPQAKRAASQRAQVAERNRQNRTQGRQYTRGTGQQNGRQTNGGNNRFATSRPASYSEVYGLLTERNIFLKDRRQPSSTSAPAVHAGPAPRVGERALVLTGVTIERDGLHAYFEDLTANSIKRVSLGDVVGQGRLLNIDIDSVEYESNGQKKLIKVGQDLTGTDAEPAPSYAASGTGATTLPAELVGKSLNDPSLTPEQKMKLRRAMEMQKQ